MRSDIHFFSSSLLLPSERGLCLSLSTFPTHHASPRISFPFVFDLILRLICCFGLLAFQPLPDAVSLVTRISNKVWDIFTLPLVPHGFLITSHLRALASASLILLIFIIIFGIVARNTILLPPSTFWILWIFTACIMLVYGLSRIGRFSIAASLSIVSLLGCSLLLSYQMRFVAEACHADREEEHTPTVKNEAMIDSSSDHDPTVWQLWLEHADQVGLFL